ncbi:dense granule protein gra12 [Cystoisospora suis]|uniref:Dense granule protein gra12 n=1 Tax=Cystoisospora suis TaxID=483139 RepID=A0A2C6KSP9_9APIC|nr:dense granule protein gra12 [Cystoisospora suis]
MEAGACFIGGPKNLVVEPLSRPPYPSPQPLDTTATGAALCLWLDRMFHSHMALKPLWEQKHAEEKAKTSWWKFWRRLSNWAMSFPAFRVDLTVTYVDLWDKDFYGNALPWLSARFRYRPDSAGSYGLFRDLENGFAVYPNGPLKDVTVLLVPSPTFNTLVHPTGSTLAGVVQTLASSSPGNSASDGAELFVSTPSVEFIPGSTIISFEAQASDFWPLGRDCMLSDRFAIRWASGASGVCEFLNEQFRSLSPSSGSPPTVSVIIDIVGMDILNNNKPIFRFYIREKSRLRKLTRYAMSMVLVTDPKVNAQFLKVALTRALRQAVGTGNARPP